MYARWLERGWLLIVLAFVAAGIATGSFLPRLTVDASTNVLLDEKDPDLTYYSESRRQWPSDDEFAIICCRRADWFTPESLEVLRGFQTDLENPALVPGAKKTLSLLSIPLLRQKPLPIPMKIDAKGVDLAKAREEMTNHAVARGTFISPDGKDTVLLVYLDQPPGYADLDRAWTDAQRTGDEATLAAMSETYETARAELRARRKAMVEGIRAVSAKWTPQMEIPVRLSGLPIINLSLVEFVSHDVDVFGLASFSLFTLAFLVVYRRLRWTAYPILTCLLPVVIVVGAMTALGQKLTVITANLPLLLFVLMLPYTVYFVERYRERRATIQARRSGESHSETTTRAAQDIWLPCLYSCTTTMAGFASLLTSGVKPVWWFGLMMTVGLAVGFGCTFLFLPAATIRQSAVEDPNAKAEPEPASFVRALVRFVIRVPGVAVAAGAVVLGLGVWGTTFLTVENKFIDYFKPESEVSQGLAYIDRQMGGTTPMDIVLKSETPGFFKTDAGLAAIRAASEHVATKVPEVGNVSSLATLLDEVHKSKVLSRMSIESLAKMADVKPLLADVVTDDFSTTRVLVRFRETAETLHRRRILDGLRADLAARPELKDVTCRITGVFLLYSNMLEALLQSQKDTFWAVVLAIYLMLVTLFGVRRVLVQLPIAVCLSVAPFFVPTTGIAIGVGAAAALALILAVGARADERLAAAGMARTASVVHTLALGVIVLIPQVLPAVAVLGVMGWARVPLDLITVTIAAIAMGVGIDAAIQYTVRFRIELAASGDDRAGDRAAAVTRSHATIGRSIWIATSIMVGGFGVMVFSDFVPTVYFGVFNALAMVMGQFATLTVLPALFLLTGLPRQGR